MSHHDLISISRFLNAPSSKVDRGRLLATVMLVLLGFPLPSWAGVNTTTVLSLSSSTVTIGTPVVLTATVTAQSSTAVTNGQVIFCDANATYCQDPAVIGTAQLTPAGTATISIMLGPGNHSVKAVFVGNNSNAGSVSAIQSVSVSGELPSTTGLVVTGIPGNYTISSTVTTFGIANGQVNFLDANNGNAQVATAVLDPATAVQSFPQSNYAVPYPTYFVAAADFNGDGRPDLALANQYRNSVIVLLGNGDGTFQAQQQFATGNAPQSIAVGDFDSDGKPDMAITNVLDQTVSILRGNGDGTFQPQRTFAVGSYPESLKIADFNNDGIQDLVVANRCCSQTGIQTVSILLGNGDGTFQPQKTEAVAGNPMSVAVGDFNGDGNVDVVTAGPETNSISVLLGKGDGTFHTQITYSTGSAPVAVVVGDFNRDGRPDIAVANSNSRNVSVLLGNGDGTFQPQQTFAVQTDPSGWSLALGDMNGDGKLDLVVGNSTNTAPLVILPGNGDGTFQSYQTFPEGNGPQSVAVADFNGDGQPDVVAANVYSASVSVLLNMWSVEAVASPVSVPGNMDTHTLSASYAGDAQHSPSSSTGVYVTGTKMTITIVSPASAFVGGGSLSLTVNGTFFNSDSVLQWNGSALPTKVVNSSQLIATVPATLTGGPGSASLAVVFGRFTSDPMAFSVVSPFGLSLSPTSLTIAAPGSSSSAAITIAAGSGYSGTVGLSCVVAYNGQGTPHEAPMCSVSSADVSINGTSAASATLTVSTTAPHVIALIPGSPSKTWLAFGGSSAVFSAGMFLIPWGRPEQSHRKRKVFYRTLFLSIFLSLLIGSGCGGGGNNNVGSGGTSDPGTTAGSYTVTVNATTGSYSSSLTVPTAVQ